MCFFFRIVLLDNDTDNDTDNDIFIELVQRNKDSKKIYIYSQFGKSSII